MATLIYEVTVLSLVDHDDTERCSKKDENIMAEKFNKVETSFPWQNWCWIQALSICSDESACFYELVQLSSSLPQYSKTK